MLQSLHLTAEEYQIERIQELCGYLNNALLKELFSMFLEECCELEEKCKLAIEQNDIHSILDSVHKLKGTSINIGLKKTHDLCLAFELQMLNTLKLQPKQSIDYQNVQLKCKTLFETGLMQGNNIINITTN